MDAESRPLNLHEYEEAARAVLPAMYFDYVAHGAEDDVTLRGNRVAFDRWRLVPRVLRGVREVSLAAEVLGQQVSMPVLVAPMGYHRILHDSGEIATASAARGAGTLFMLSTVSTVSIEEVAPHAGDWWFQLYAMAQPEETLDLIQRAEAYGASALVITVDTPRLGRREVNVRNRFVLPGGVGMANFPSPERRQIPPRADGSGLNRVSEGFEIALAWAQIDGIARSTLLPIVLKGILSPADALLAVEHGARAIVVSNHGGRQLDGAIAPLDALPAVVDAVAGRAEVYLDGGIRRGTDVLKALALGAKAVLLGRPILWGLAVAAEEGVAHVLELIRDEIALDLLLCSLAGVAEIDRSLVAPDGPLPLGWGIS